MAKNETMLGVVFDQSNSNQPLIDSDNSNYYIPFYKTEEYFEVYENLINFVKACEALVRKHRFYKTYIKYLIDVVGMNTCQVLPNIECSESNDVTIEMHHGPILTLFDTCMIVLNHLRSQGCKDITTFKIANIVLEEHRLNNVRVLLLAKSVHQQVHEDQIHLNYQMGWGNTKLFLEKYKYGLDKSLIRGINSYIEWSKENESFDDDVLAISEHMKLYGNNDFDEFDKMSWE